MGGRFYTLSAIEDVIPTLDGGLPADTTLLAAVLIGVVILGVAGYGLYRYLTRTQADKLLRVLGRYDSVAILMHPNPDPDAMGAAIGVEELAAAAGTAATVYYPGQIRRQENRAFQTVLDLDFEQVESSEQLTEDAVVLVDHNRARGFQQAEQIDPVAVIDHHPGDGTGSEFTDVRTDHGACASIISEYFRDLEAPIGGNGKDRNLTDGGTRTADGQPRLHSAVATGLLYGIQADTDHLTKGCSAAEFEASSYLFPGINEDLLERIANPQVTSEMLEIKARAIQDRKINGSYAIADVGEISEVDAIPQAAEELIRLEGISAVVVYASKDKTIHLSGRSRDDRVHMGKTLEAVFEDIPMASAGGHARMGGGQVPLQYLAGIGPSAVDEDRARSDLRGMLFNALKGNV